MIGCNIKMKKIIYVTVGVFFSIIILHIYIISIQRKFDSNVKNISEMIINNIDNNCSINILYDDGDFYTISATVEILFGESNKIVISRVNENLKGDDMRIEKIGSYRFIGFNSDYSGSPYLHKKVLESELSIELKSVIDIVNNYEKIYLFVESLEDIDSERYAGYKKTSDRPWGTYDVNWPWNMYDSNFNIFEQGGKKNIIFRKNVPEITRSQNFKEERKHNDLR